MLYIVNTKVLTMLYTTEIDTGDLIRCQSHIALKVAIEVLDSCRLRWGRSELGALGGGAPQTPAGGLRPPDTPCSTINFGQEAGSNRSNVDRGDVLYQTGQVLYPANDRRDQAAFSASGKSQGQAGE